jgi:KUP system potassium uptake protein
MNDASTEHAHGSEGHTSGLGILAIGALGVVYGDIGTSPLYAFREAFEGHDLAVTRDNLYGACSLVFWALVIVITFKYLVFVMRADNRGEGGILALTSLVAPVHGRVAGRSFKVLLILGLFGTALLYGDGVITPAISVLSAVEGLEVATSAVDDWVIPIAIVILIGLFAVQKRGTGAVGRIFGPVMIVWFTVLAMLGLRHIVSEPGILTAVNPVYAWRYFTGNSARGFLSLGSIFLVVTGGEALYADMGHFGRRPIQVGWFAMVLPALLLNYFGQGAMLIRHPESIHSPFFLMGPSWSTYPLVILATMATVIASQALISGAFSMTVQAIQLDYLPRMTITHTSASQSGQVYVPMVNWVLMVGCIGLVVGFGSSSNLAAAYGIAVTATMAITTMLFYAFATTKLGWSKLAALSVAIPFMIVDLGFLGANLAKIPDGGWFAIVVAVVLIVMMTTWKRGRQLVAERIRRGQVPIDQFLASLDTQPIQRVPGTAVFMFRGSGAAPPALLSNVKHNHVLHENVVLLSVLTADRPRVAEDKRATVVDLGRGLFEVTLTYGFMEEPDVSRSLAALTEAPERDLHARTTFFLGRETVIASALPGMATWREKLFAWQLRSSLSASRFFRLPSDRIYEVGSHVEI